MRAVALKITVATAGTPVNIGVTTLNGTLAPGATSLSVTSAVPFSPDMLPFILTVDTGANQEKVQITAMNGATWTCSPVQLAHLTAVAARADDFHIAGFTTSAIFANTGVAYLGTRNMATGGGAGTIKRFAVTPSTGIDDTLQIMLNSQDGDPGTITEYVVDVATNTNGLWFTAWVR